MTYATTEQLTSDGCNTYMFVSDVVVIVGKLKLVWGTKGERDWCCVLITVYATHLF